MATIGSKYPGGIPLGLPGWHFPPITLDAMRELMAPAFTIAALGGIEWLLSAMVADGMTDTRHDSNQELIGQGIANILTPLVGGIAATGAIARTAANIRNGARSPVSGMVHALVLLGGRACSAAPLAQYIPARLPQRDPAHRGAAHGGMGHVPRNLARSEERLRRAGRGVSR